VQITSAFIAAARASPNEIDADVQIALGLLFNMSHDYEKAVGAYHSFFISMEKFLYTNN
jgi:peroxin-5